jgi:hypothetical protein
MAEAESAVCGFTEAGPCDSGAGTSPFVCLHKEGSGALMAKRTALAEFKDMVGEHTQVTMIPQDRSIQQRAVTAITPRGIHTRLPWGSQPEVFIDWPTHWKSRSYEITGTTLTWLNNGYRQFSYTFPLTREQALAAAYDEDGRPLNPPNKKLGHANG